VHPGGFSHLEMTWLLYCTGAATAQNSSGNLLSYFPDNQCCSDVVYCRNELQAE